MLLPAKYLTSSTIPLIYHAVPPEVVNHPRRAPARELLEVLASKNKNNKMTALVKFPPCYFRKPAHLNAPSVFLAGTIDMGNSVDWQQLATERLADVASVIYNPRRPDWDSSWTQEIDSPEFNIQVNWELDHIDTSDYVIMYFAPGSQSPITLLELGLIAGKYAHKLLVCCPDGFWRKGNVDIVCNKYSVKMYDTLDALLANTRELFADPVASITAPLV
jgi:hypothetical protein